MAGIAYWYPSFLQHGDAMADLKTSSSSTVVDNISSVYGPSVAR